MARSFADQGNDYVDTTGGGPLYGQTQATIMCWFKRGTAPTSGFWPTLFFQEANFNEQVKIEMKSAGDADDGKFAITWRTPSQYTQFISTNTWDDDVWHRLVLIRSNSNPYVELFIDGVSDGTQATDPLTDASSPLEERWGSFVGNGGASDNGWGGELARCAFILGASLSVNEGDAFLYTGRIGRSLTNWIEMGIGSPEPDWSGNGNNGTVSGASIADHAPASSPFGVDSVLIIPSVLLSTIRTVKLIRSNQIPIHQLQL
ncbi:MAG: LamG-like jellyroll fold domain-containing protein [Candidatus Kariarchaeaceae archaeon]|jgi:hypothetical protein